MRWKNALLLTILLAALPPMTLAQDSRALLSNVAEVMGTVNLRTIEYSGTGSTAAVGQNKNPDAAWPVTPFRSYTRRIDYDALTSHVEILGLQNSNPPTQNQYVRPDSPWAQLHDFYLTPPGFVKAAMAATDVVIGTTPVDELVGGVPYTTVTFTLQNQYRLVGYIDAQNLVAKVETWIDNTVLGDMMVDAVFRDYRDHNGVKFPGMIINKRAGWPSLILMVDDVEFDVSGSADVPQQVQAAPAPAEVEMERVADGVFYIRGGSHHSVAVEMSDHVVVIEAPLNEQRSLAVIQEVQRRIPNKPIRYVVNTHHHFDHSGGLRTYVDAGATVVIHHLNRFFFETVLSSPRTLSPDRLSRSGRTADILVVADKAMLSDGTFINERTRTIELHLLRDNPHADGMLMAYLPRERMVIAADVFTPSLASAAPETPPAPDPATINFVENLERLNLSYDRVLALHGPGDAAKADLYRAAGKEMPGTPQRPEPARPGA